MANNRNFTTQGLALYDRAKNAFSNLNQSLQQPNPYGGIGGAEGLTRVGLSMVGAAPQGLSAAIDAAGQAKSGIEDYNRAAQRAEQARIDRIEAANVARDFQANQAQLGRDFQEEMFGQKTEAAINAAILQREQELADRDFDKKTKLMLKDLDFKNDKELVELKKSLEKQSPNDFRVKILNRLEEAQNNNQEVKLTDAELEMLNVSFQTNDPLTQYFLQEYKNSQSSNNSALDDAVQNNQN